ncbi:exodeoxyribonuclease VII small subunit [Brachybacterium phenoliresistens]|uniref:exodeoxyribonuclease VII small subunit n=1 Tax=Brachybacterium phenoliresistens TaxID=396014 RepID=UPI0031CF8C27
MTDQSQDQLQDARTAAAADAPLQPAAEADEQPLPEDIAALSYEAARDQLVEVVRRLESGQGGLEESISLWERGEMLARRCQQWLDGARERLDHAMAARGEQ